MMTVRSARGLMESMYVLRGFQPGRLLLRRGERTSFNFIHNVRTTHIGPTRIFRRKAVNADILANAEINTMKSKLSKYQIYCTSTGETMDSLPNNQIPISLVTRIMQIEDGIKPKKSESKLPRAASKFEPATALRVIHSEPSISLTPKGTSKALVPYASNTALRNDWRQPTAQRPKIEDLQKNSNFKETYEKLRRLGLLKARMGNCHVGMTSPSGKMKAPTTKVGTSVTKPAGKIVRPSSKIPQMENKFLQNNVVLKVQHYYNSQGKDMPEELKSLMRGSRNRNPASTDTFTDLKRRRYQVYPCTSPSSTYFTRTMKK